MRSQCSRWLHPYIRVHCRLQSTSPEVTDVLSQTQREISQDDQSHKRKSDKDGQRESRTVRERAGKQSLPLSPLFDPIKIDSRFRWHELKPRKSSEELSDFQKKFRQNAYAHILSQPVRSCAHTKLRLPSELLLRFHIIPRPKTSAATFVPAQLVRSVSPHHLPIPHGPSLGILLSKAILRDMDPKRAADFVSTPQLQLWMRRADIANRHEPDVRPDMPDIVHVLLRRALFRKLRGTILLRDDGLIVPRRAGDDLDALDDVACVVYLRPVFPLAREAGRRLAVRIDKADTLTGLVKEFYADPKSCFYQPHHNSSIHVRHRAALAALVPTLQPWLLNPLQEFDTVPWRGTRVPVYDLVEEMGGEEEARAVVKDTRFEGAECLVLLHRQKTAGSQTALLKLAAFTALRSKEDLPIRRSKVSRKMKRLIKKLNR